MDLKKVSEEMIPLILKSNLVELHPEYGKNHLFEMCNKIYNGVVTGEKAHRWIGWIQAVICISGGSSLEKLSEINSSFKEVEKEKPYPKFMKSKYSGVVILFIQPRGGFVVIPGKYKEFLGETFVNLEMSNFEDVDITEKIPNIFEDLKI